MKNVLAATLLVPLLGFLVTASAERAAQGPTYAPGEVREDLDQFLEIVAHTHPNLAYSTDLEALEQAAMRVRDGVDQPLTTRDVWKSMAVLNPIFRDAHVGLQYPTREFDAYREAGGVVFPIAVYVDDSGALRVAEGSDANGRIRAHEEIVAINEISVADFLREAVPLMRGETTAIQHLVLTYNFAAYFWTIAGPQKSYTMTLRADDGRTRRLMLPESTEPQRPRTTSNAFRVEVLQPGIAYMEVRSFDISLREEFEAFLKDSFSRIRSSQIRRLIIDIRRNPGGAHELSDALLDYLADKPVRQASRLVARVVEQNRDMAPRAAVGDVVELAWDEWLKPSDNPLRFHGESFLLIGSSTYSQAIVFAAILQDFGLGTLAGEPTGGWANQTGQVQMTALGHTGLLAAAPLYIIVRPSGEMKRAGIVPDVLIPDDPANPRAMIDEVLKTTEARR